MPDAVQFFYLFGLFIWAGFWVIVWGLMTSFRRDWTRREIPEYEVRMRRRSALALALTLVWPIGVIVMLVLWIRSPLPTEESDG